MLYFIAYDTKAVDKFLKVCVCVCLGGNASVKREKKDHVQIKIAMKRFKCIHTHASVV